MNTNQNQNRTILLNRSARLSQAHDAAVVQLIEAHRDEFNRYREEQAEQRGVGSVPIEQHSAKPSTLTRHRTAAGDYELHDGTAPVIRVARTGVPGRDTYPWDWYILAPVRSGIRNTGVASTLAEAVDVSGARWAQSQS